MLYGTKLREIRKRRHLTLAQLGERTGLTAGMLSKVERGLATPSLAALMNITAALQSEVGQLFEDPNPVGRTWAEGVFPVLLESQRKIISSNPGLVLQMLNPDPDSLLKMFLCIFEPGASTGEELYTHEDLECGVVLEGELEIRIDGQTRRLGKGDSIAFSGEVPHLICNEGEIRTIYIMAMCPIASMPHQS